MKRIAVSLLTIGWMATSASAHIHLVTPISHTDQLTGEQKNEHCGDTVAYDRAAHPERVTTYAPGSTVNVTWMETINHTGHFRIAFQPDGTKFRIPQKAGGGFPVDPLTDDETGKTDDAATALPIQANTVAPTPSGSIILADFIADGTLSKTIVLPDIECANCTLQFIQLMTDNPPYTTDANSDDIYFSCADIILKAGAVTPIPPTPDAGVPANGDAGTGEIPSGENATTGGCSTTSSSTGFAFGLALLVGLRRRRR